MAAPTLPTLDSALHAAIPDMPNVLRDLVMEYAGPTPLEVIAALCDDQLDQLIVAEYYQSVGHAMETKDEWSPLTQQALRQIFDLYARSYEGVNAIGDNEFEDFIRVTDPVSRQFFITPGEVLGCYGAVMLPRTWVAMFGDFWPHYPYHRSQQQRRMHELLSIHATEFVQRKFLMAEDYAHDPELVPTDAEHQYQTHIAQIEFAMDAALNSGGFQVVAAAASQTGPDDVD